MYFTVTIVEILTIGSISIRAIQHYLFPQCNSSTLYIVNIRELCQAFMSMTYDVKFDSIEYIGLS